MGRRTSHCESSKGKSQFEVVNVGKIAKGKLCGACRERGGNALRRTAWFVVVLFSNALERKFILVRCWNLRPFAAQPAHHPHGRRPLERAYLAAARTGHLAPLGTNSEASLVMALKCLPRRLVEWAHTLNKAGKHLAVASMPRLLYITA